MTWLKGRSEPHKEANTSLKNGAKMVFNESKKIYLDTHKIEDQPIEKEDNKHSKECLLKPNTTYMEDNRKNILIGQLDLS